MTRKKLQQNLNEGESMVMVTLAFNIPVKVSSYLTGNKHLDAFKVSLMEI